MKCIETGRGMNCGCMYVCSMCDVRAIAGANKSVEPTENAERREIRCAIHSYAFHRFIVQFRIFGYLLTGEARNVHIQHTTHAKYTRKKIAECPLGAHRGGIT